jgi:hypothetical protein
MDHLSLILSNFEFLSVVTLTADSKGRREYQLAEYKKAYALLLDTRPIWDECFEIKNAALSADHNLKKISKQLVETELVIEAVRVIDAAILIK